MQAIFNVEEKISWMTVLYVAIVMYEPMTVTFEVVEPDR